MNLKPIVDRIERLEESHAQRQRETDFHSFRIISRSRADRDRQVSEGRANGSIKPHSVIVWRHIVSPPRTTTPEGNYNYG